LKAFICHLKNGQKRKPQQKRRHANDNIKETPTIDQPAAKLDEDLVNSGPPNKQ
jgi:hypothetical protein